MKRTIFSIGLALSLITVTLATPIESRAENETYVLTREEILNAQKDNYDDTDVLKWNGYLGIYKDKNDGSIPSVMLDDPVYCSMNLPSESQSDYMKSVRRDNAHVLGNVSSPQAQAAVSIGAIYRTSGQTLPDNFTVYIGKISLFAYSKSQGRWIVVDSKPHPERVSIYTLPWTSSQTIQLSNIEYTDSYAKIELTANDLNNAVLHFWGEKKPINNEDYIYYASAYECWCDESAVGKLTTTCGIDVKASTGSKPLLQLYSSRGLASSAEPRVNWGHNVPNSEYNQYNTSVLNDLFRTQ